MNTIIGYLLSMNTETLVLGVFMIVYCIVLSVTHGLIFKSKDGKRKKTLVSVWYAASSVPIIVCGIHFAGHYLKGLLLYSLKLYMPMYPTVGDDGNPLIDTSSERKSRFSVDERIPITREAALEIFSFEDSGKDYELDYAITLFD